MPEDQTPPEMTGLEDLIVPAAAPSEPTAPPSDPVSPPPAPEQLEAERVATKAAADAEERLAAERLAKAEEPADTRSEARKLNDQIHERIITARLAAREAEKPKPPQPASLHVMEQTKREMAEGARQSEWHRQQRELGLAQRKPPPPRPASMSPAPVPEGNTEVFRPNDYIPDQVKGQGNIKVLS